MASLNPAPFVRFRFLIPVLCVMVMSACRTLPFYEEQKDLEGALKYYYNNLEGKLLDRNALLVHPDKREEFMMRVPELIERVTFLEIKILNVEFLNDGVPVPPDPGFGEGKFNEAMVPVRYQLIMNPSNTLKTVILRHKWVLNRRQWFVYPQLDALLNP